MIGKRDNFTGNIGMFTAPIGGTLLNHIPELGLRQGQVVGINGLNYGSSTGYKPLTLASVVVPGAPAFVMPLELVAIPDDNKPQMEEAINFVRRSYIGSS